MQTMTKLQNVNAEAETMPARGHVTVKLSLSRNSKASEQKAMEQLENDGSVLSSNNIELPASSWCIRIGLFFMLAVVVGLLQGFPSLSSTSAIAVPNSLYITGGGLSGLYHLLGKLQNMSDEELDTDTIFCYSAGCFAMVMRRRHWSIEKLITTNKSAQHKWHAGDFRVQDMLKYAVDEIVDELEDDDDLSWMSNMVILTSNRVVGQEEEQSSLDDFLMRGTNSTSFSLGEFGGLNSVATIPDSKEMLRRVLLQSAWIPFVTGDGLMHEQAVDGGFTSMLHPKCSRQIDVGSSWNWWYLVNMLNPSITESAAMRFMREGMENANKIIS